MNQDNWLKKNLKYITIILLALFLIKAAQSCNRKMSLRIIEKKLITKHDSITLEKNNLIDSLKIKILTKDFIIKDLTTNLKIADIRVDEAQKRVDAIQKTVEKIRANTIIEIRGAERDTIQNK